MKKYTETELKSFLESYMLRDSSFSRFEFSSQNSGFRPDFVLLNKKDFIYYEIKSDYDSFKRLPNQVYYSKGFFTKVYLVCSNNFFYKHFDQFMELRGYDLNLGYIQAESLERGEIRSAIGSTRRKLDMGKVLSLAWKDELKALIKFKMPSAKVYNKNMGWLFDLAKTLYKDEKPIDVLNSFLPQRVYWN